MKNLLFVSYAIVFALLFSAQRGHAQWAQTNGPNVANVYCLALDSTHLLAGTNGAGVFRSSDNGTSWVVSSKGMTDFYVT